jgi:DNA-binding winged helix-turn-helix (wHTH) protein
MARGGEPFELPDRQLDILLLLVSKAGQVVSKDALIDAAWKDVAVGDNSLEQAISALRRTLGVAPDGQSWIETLARRGYRFRGAVARDVARHTDAQLDALLAPHRAFIEGRSALETLGSSAVARARDVFGEVVAALPEYASGHIGLANALALGFEATRADENPDTAALTSAVQHAREACQLDSGSGEAWATLAFVLSRAGAGSDAAAAGRRAIAIEPDDWRHHLRLASVTWGEERLRAAGRTLKLLPGVALAHWLAATVHVARQALDAAADTLVAGTTAQDRQPDGGRFAGVGLHLLLGLVRLAQGNRQDAMASFERELAFESAGHLYSREASANTWCAIGAVRLRAGDRGAADAAFERALALVHAHPLVLAGVGKAAQAEMRAQALAARGLVVEAAMTRAVDDALAGRHADGAARVHTALQSAPAGSSSGWTLPVEPLLDVAGHLDLWAPALAILRSRAA